MADETSPTSTTGSGREARDAYPKKSRLVAAERWTSLATGGALAAYGIKRRTLGGIAAIGAGGLLLYRGIRGPNRPERDGYAEASFTILRPSAELFQYWRNLENLPKFMYHLDMVRVIDQRRSHWVAKGPMGLRISWDAEIVDEQEDQWLVWRSLPGSDLAAHGSVRFRPAPGDRGTEVTVAMQYECLGGKMGRMVASVLGRDLQWSIREELRRFKQLMEAGEIATVAGQPSGRRSAMVSLLQEGLQRCAPFGTTGTQNCVAATKADLRRGCGTETFHSSRRRT